MKTYFVKTYIRLEVYRNPMHAGISKIIEVPFLPYQFEGKKLRLTFESSNGERITKDAMVVYVLWEQCGVSAEGEWMMCISIKVSERIFEEVAYLIRNDVLHKNLEF